MGKGCGGVRSKWESVEWGPYPLPDTNLSLFLTLRTREPAHKWDATTSGMLPLVGCYHYEKIGTSIIRKMRVFV